MATPFQDLAVLCDPLPLTSSSAASSSSPPQPSAAALFASSSVNFRCPEQFGYYADEYNCSKYFVCVFGEALHESCTGGLRFSSELQTCDWPRNVVCPSEDLDSSYDDEGDEGNGDSASAANSHSKSVGSGNMVQELTTSRSGLVEGYVKEATGAANLGGKLASGVIQSSHRPQSFTTTPAPAATFTTEDNSGEQINEAALQESFDKLSRHSSRHKSKQQQQQHSVNPSLTYDLVKNAVPDINYLDLAVPRDINNNKLDVNGTADGDLRGDELDENFTLVDLQRSRISLDGGKSFRGQGSNSKANFNDNILGTIGRSVNGANRAQSVSVVASTSSEAMIPELDFVFKKPSKSGQEKNRGLSDRHQISLDEVHLTDFADANGRTPKFDEAITAIVDENGAIHIDGEEGPALLRIIAPLTKKKPFSGQNSLPGTAASNRNTASQQMVLAKNTRANQPAEDKLLFTTSQNAADKSANRDSELENLDIKTLKTGAGTILVFNRTQLISLTTESGDGSNSGNGSSTFILIDHQQPTATVQDGRQSLLSAYEAAGDLKHRLNDRPRQPIIIRTEKEDSSGLQVGGQLAAEGVRGRSFGQANKTITGQLLGSKERQKSSQKQAAPPPSTAIHDEEDIELLVEIAPTAEEIDDFQRLNGKGRGNSTSNSEFRQPKYLTDKGNSSQPLHRGSHARHLGSHQRSTSLKSNSSSKASHNRFVNSTLQTPARPITLYGTPEPLSPASKCTDDICRLPDCFCGGTEIPGALPVKDVPQLVLISFDDAVNDVNWHIYEELLNSGRSNPNGCPIKATFYVSHEWTDYSQVQTLYSRGHEIASHSITHSFGERFTKQQWEKEIVGQREILHLYGGVNRADIRGMRAPFLQGGGNKQFEMLYENNFTYDSSYPVFENQPPFWPYTLDYALGHDCMIDPCPTRSFPGIWEIGMVMWEDLRGGRCSMGDACTNPSDEDGVYEMIMKNFNRHYKSNRAPFSLYYHSAWFNKNHHWRGFLRVIDDLLTNYKDVYFVTKWELIQWIRNPTPLKELYRVNLFGCARDPHRAPPCLHPNICNVGSHSGSRFLKTCQPCPKRYPWLGDNGLK